MDQIIILHRSPFSGNVHQKVKYYLFWTIWMNPILDYCPNITLSICSKSIN